MEETEDTSYQGVPILSSIPILGHLFRYNTDLKTKKELVIIITPHVISNRNEAEMLTAEFLDKLHRVKAFLVQKDMRIKTRTSEEIIPDQINE